MLPYVSPALAFVSFAQFVSEFRGFGEIWPPSVVALLDFFETLWTLNLESLNSECAVGRVLFPSSYWGRRVMRMLFPILLAHAYVLWMTAQQAADLIARTLLPRLCLGGRSNGNNTAAAAAATDATAEPPRGRWARYRLRVAAEAASIAEARRVSGGELRQARGGGARAAYPYPYP